MLQCGFFRTIGKLLMNRHNCSYLNNTICRATFRICFKGRGGKQLFRYSRGGGGGKRRGKKLSDDVPIAQPQSWGGGTWGHANAGFKIKKNSSLLLLDCPLPA